jgi:MFS family permease
VNAFDPLSHRAFRWLWIALVVSSGGMWMQALGAQWFLVSQPGGAAYVALVQTALTLPVAILALPAGVLADNLNRRSLLLAVQAGSLAVGVVLTILMVTDSLDPRLLLALTALIGCGFALTLTPFQSLIPDLVSRERIPAAAALVGVGANIARIVGPAIAGFLIASIGIASVFAACTLSSVAFVVILLRWNGTTPRVSQRERFLPAMKSGVRYVRHSPQVIKLMLRSFWFTAPMMAVFALLPIVATTQLNMGSGGYGLLFACLGVGAVIGGGVPPVWLTSICSVWRCWKDVCHASCLSRRVPS